MHQRLTDLLKNEETLIFLLEDIELSPKEKALDPTALLQKVIVEPNHPLLARLRDKAGKPLHTQAKVAAVCYPVGNQKATIIIHNPTN